MDKIYIFSKAPICLGEEVLICVLLDPPFDLAGYTVLLMHGSEKIDIYLRYFRTHIFKTSLSFSIYLIRYLIIPRYGESWVLDGTVPTYVTVPPTVPN